MHGPSPAARYAVLGAGAVGAFSRAAAYLPGAPRPDFRYLAPAEALLPIQVWAYVWGGIGVLLFLSCFVRRISITALSLLTGILTLWGFSYLYAYLFHDVSRSWVTGALFVMVAVWAGALASMLERGE